MDISNFGELEQANFMDIVMAAMPAALFEYIVKPDPIPCRTSALTGRLYYLELINSINEVRFIEVVRMRKFTFFLLLRKLKVNELKDSRKLCAGEKLMIFIYIFVELI